MSEHIQKLFDSIAPQYDLLNSLLSFQVDRRWRRQGMKEFSDSKKFQKILDLCAGTLALSKTLLETNPMTQITAVDFSENMLKKGEALLTPEERKQIQIQIGDILALDIPRSSYDGAMVAYGMRNVGDNPLALQNIYEWLKPGGRLVVLEFFKPTELLPKLFNITYAEVVIPVLGSLVSKNKSAYEHLRDSVRKFYTTEEYRKLLEQTGFKNIKITAQTGGISHLIVADK
ncbi:MAG: ubiquinone/menaquinone biosynthesis methyltransferase [Deltaproteobacteria bacterium]|nr:MAG: ubiquinone/menaquinone biosynthesis methyltransferase [Deltaproteobacteria bacterium]